MKKSKIKVISNYKRAEFELEVNALLADGWTIKNFFVSSPGSSEGYDIIYALMEYPATPTSGG